MCLKYDNLSIVTSASVEISGFIFSVIHLFVFLVIYDILKESSSTKIHKYQYLFYHVSSKSSVCFHRVSQPTWSDLFKCRHILASVFHKDFIVILPSTDLWCISRQFVPLLLSILESKSYSPFHCLYSLSISRLFIPSVVISLVFFSLSPIFFTVLIKFYY